MDEELMGASAPEKKATPEAGLSAEEAKGVPLTLEPKGVPLTLEPKGVPLMLEPKGVPLMLEPKGDFPCRHSTIKISGQW